MLKVKFLGVNGSVQDYKNGNTSILIIGESGSAVVDLSCNLTAVLEEDIDAVILTHEHIDHIYALPSLLHQLWISGRNRLLPIYLSKELNPLVKALIDLFQLQEKKNMFSIKLCVEDVFKVGDIHFRTFPTDHTDASIGVIAEDSSSKLIYTGDTRPLKEIPSFFEGTQVLIHETSGLQKEEEILLKKGHASGADAGKLAQRLKVKQLYLCHLPKEEKEKIAILNEAKMIFSETYIPEVLTDISIGIVDEHY